MRYNIFHGKGARMSAVAITVAVAVAVAVYGVVPYLLVPRYCQ